MEIQVVRVFISPGMVMKPKRLLNKMNENKEGKGTEIKERFLKIDVSPADSIFLSLSLSLEHTHTHTHTHRHNTLIKKCISNLSWCHISEK
jgi:hypothetical protein